MFVSFVDGWGCEPLPCCREIYWRSNCRSLEASLKFSESLLYSATFLQKGWITKLDCIPLFTGFDFRFSKYLHGGEVTIFNSSCVTCTCCNFCIAVYVESKNSTQYNFCA